jgi:hypothetical protein
MPRSRPRLLLALLAGLSACGTESPAGLFPAPTTPTFRIEFIGTTGDTLSVKLHTFVAVSAWISRSDSAPVDPQPAVEWSVVDPDGVVLVESSETSPYRLVTGSAQGHARLITAVPSLGIKDSLVVRVWSPVASLLFELNKTTFVEGEHIDWRLEARDSAGALVPAQYRSISVSDDSLAILNSRYGVATRVGTGQIIASAPPFRTEIPVSVVPLVITDVRNGDAHRCVLRDDARVLCAGMNVYRQLGRTTPTNCIGFFGQYCVLGPGALGDVPDLGTVSALDVARGYSCAIRLDGELLCWGGASEGLLGTHEDNGGCGNPIAGWPIQSCLLGARLVGAPLRYRAVSTGWATACALTVDDRAWCWGGVELDSRLGDGSTSASETPVAVSGDHRFRSIAAGYATACAVDFDDAAWCWGRGGDGELGAGAGVSTATVPTPVVGGIAFQTAQNGRWGTCGLSTEGQAFCWGGEESYRGGAPLDEACVDDAVPSSCAATPMAVAGALRFVELAVGGEACGRTAAGEVWCWRSQAPQQVTGAPALTTVRMTPSGGCGVSAAGRAWCWANGVRVAN